MIGHGALEGPFTEIDGLEVERHPDFPIRVTVQFYKATSNGVVSPDDMAAVAAEIERVYAQADWVGSLVTEGHTERPTEHGGPQVEPTAWWADFWKQHEAETGESPAEAQARLARAYGADWRPADRDELTRALLQAPAEVRRCGVGDEEPASAAPALGVAAGALLLGLLGLGASFRRRG